MEKKYYKFKVIYKGETIVEFPNVFYVDEEFKKDVILAVRNHFLKDLTLAYKEEKVWKQEKRS